MKIKGYGTGHLANRELAYFSWEGTTKAVPKEGGAFDLTGSGTFTWLGGTGKISETKRQRDIHLQRQSNRRRMSGGR